MKHVLSLLLVSLAATACLDNRRVEPSPTDEATSELTSVGDGTGAKTNVTCQHIWECDPVCGRYQNGVLVRYPTNVLHNECDDGTDTVIHTDPCGENCY